MPPVQPLTCRVTGRGFGAISAGRPIHTPGIQIHGDRNGCAATTRPTRRHNDVEVNMDKVERAVLAAIFGIAAGFAIGAGAVRFHDCMAAGGHVNQCIVRAFG